MGEVRTNPEHLALLETGCGATVPTSCSTSRARSSRSSRRCRRKSYRRMSANPHANGGLLLRDLALPDFRDYAVDVPRPGGTTSEATRVLGTFLRDVMSRNRETFRVFGPDETASNRLGAVFEVTDRAFDGEIIPGDDHIATDGRVMEVLSEHLCQGWLEGYLLTGRHGLFNCVRGVHPHRRFDVQPARQVAEGDGRHPVAAPDRLAQLPAQFARLAPGPQRLHAPGPRASSTTSSTRRRSTSGSTCRPTRTRCCRSADHCLRSRNYVNVIVAGKQPSPNWLTMDEAILHCTRGIGIWDFASNDEGGDPDVVMACAGDVPDPRDAGGGGHPAPRAAGPEGPRRERRGPHAPPAGSGASARPVGPRVRLAVHDGPADRVRLPRLSLAHPPADVPADEPRQPPRPRLQGGGHDHDAVRHGHAQRPRPVPPRHRRHRPGAGRRGAGRSSSPADDRPAARGAGVHATGGRGRARDPRLGSWPAPDGAGDAGATADPRRQRRLQQPEAAGARRGRRRRRLGRPAGAERRRGRGADSRGDRGLRPRSRPSVTAIVHGGTDYRGPVRLDDRGRRATSARSPTSPRSTSRSRSPASRGGERGAARRAGRRLLRHGVPRGDAGGRDDVRHPARVAQALGASAGTGSTGCHMRTRRGARRRWSAGPSRTCGS